MARVLVVDDDALSLQLLETILRRDQHAVFTSMSSVETIRLMQLHQPDLVILNDNMPIISGGDLCRHIKDDPELSMTPILLMSAGMRVRDPEYIRASQADGVLLKPCLPADVREVVNQYIAARN
ncbi:MAG: response regulator [Anaerolinea sp.]|nr:response regulator [Anaerolinea sp.]